MSRKIKGAFPIVAPMLAMLAMAPNVQAVEALSTDELIAHCEHFAEKPDSVDGVFCVRYIQGFIDGAVATDELVTLNVADEVDSHESFTDRATRTRLGRQIKRFGPSYYADFCLGEPVPLSAVVKKVIADLADPERRARSELARDVVYQTLRDAYPCGKAKVR